VRFQRDRGVNGTIEGNVSNNLVESYTFVDREEYKWYAYANFYSWGFGADKNPPQECLMYFSEEGHNFENACFDLFSGL